MKNPPDRHFTLDLHFPFSIGDGLGVINRIVLTRFNSGQRTEFSERVRKDAKDGITASRIKASMMITEAGDYDQENGAYRDEPQDSLPLKMFSKMDTLDEDRLFNATIALDFGYGGEEEWEASEDFRKMSEG